MGTAPFIQNEDPQNNEKEVGRTKVLTFNLVDNDDDIDLSTVRIYVDEGQGAGEQLAYNGSTDTFIAPYNGPSSQRVVIPNGFTFAINKTSNWILLAFMTEHVVAEDAESNLLDQSWSFTIESEWEKKDDVSYNSYNITDIDNDPEVGIIAVGIDLLQSNNRIVETINSGEDWQVAPYSDGVMVQSFTGSWHSISWTSIDEDPPIIFNKDPLDGEVGVDRDTDVSFSCYDELGGINSSATVIYINGLKVWENDAPLLGWSGVYPSITKGYRYTLTNPGVFSYGSTVTVRAIVEDNNGLVADETWSFTVGMEVRIAEPTRIPYTENIDFPFRYKATGDGNIVLSDDDKVVSDSIKLAAFIKSIPLTSLGAGMDVIPFDQLDVPTRAFIEARLQEAIELGVEGVVVAKDLFFDEDEDGNLLGVTVPYLNERLEEAQSTKLAVPTVKTDEKKK